MFFALAQIKSNFGFYHAHRGEHHLHPYVRGIAPSGLIRRLPQYSINRSNTYLAFVGQEWEQRIVAGLDSSLNKWTDTIPDHREYLLLYSLSRL